MSEILNETSSIRIIKIQEPNNDYLQLPQALAAGQEFKFSLYTIDGLPAVGILDVIHQFPDKPGRGDLKITWYESLEWGPSPASTDDSWQKTISVKNHSRSTQEVIIRFKFFP